MIWFSISFRLLLMLLLSCLHEARRVYRERGGRGEREGREGGERGRREREEREGGERGRREREEREGGRGSEV